MDESLYNAKLSELFVRFPSVQKAGFGDAYKPGLGHMLDFASSLGDPQERFRTVHVAGTNGKGSVANMLASALAADGLKVGLYTSPHILDFRERMRIIDGSAAAPVALPGTCDGTRTFYPSPRAEMISREEVWDFICSREADFDELDLSFFEITTGMALWWFAERGVDVAVIEVGLGGRLDSTNIITPELSIVTGIGLDHCALLGDTRVLIAGEKAGIFKPGVPALVGSRDPETEPVFVRMALETGSRLVFADDFPLSDEESALLHRLDLQGEYQAENLRTALCALRLLGVEPSFDALEHTAARMDFHGRWELLRRDPDIICDIGHNPPALAKNFSQLEGYLSSGRYSRLFVVYGVMADKDLAGIIPLMPRDATFITVAPQTPRAMGEGELYARLSEAFASRTERLDCADSQPGEGAEGVVHSGDPQPGGSAEGVVHGGDSQPCEGSEGVIHGGTVAEGIGLALKMASRAPGSLIYVGGSTFVVSEAVTYFEKL